MAYHHELANFIWSVADLLRGPYRPPQYERVMLPLTVLRRFDCVLAPTKAKVLARHAQLKGGKVKDLDPILNKVAGQGFHNHSPLDFEKLKGDPDHVHQHLVSYINGFSANVRTIFDYFEFDNEIQKLHESNRLFQVVSKFCDVDLHPSLVSNIQMGYVFEDLIRRFNEAANETAGDHFTPREVIHLMVELLFAPDDDLLRKPGIIRTVWDPTCGTGGMLAEAQNRLQALNPQATLHVYGQDYNKRAFAVAASDMLIKGHAQSRVECGDSLVDDKFPGLRFDYGIANVPFGVDWKAQQKEILKEHETLGFKGRFGAGLPRVNDGSLLFLLHMISKFEEVAPERQKYGSRIAIVLNGSPLFTGGAGSGESEIRKWIIENDWLETIVALPEQMFYNTGIGTYVWIVTNRKEKRRKGKIQLIDGRERWKPMRRSLGDKRRELGDDDIDAIVREHGKLKDSETCMTFDNADFGYTRVTVERPLRVAFEITSMKLDSLKAGKTEIAKLDDLAPKVRAEIVAALTEANDGKCWSNREKFRAFLAGTLPEFKRPLRELVLLLMSFKHPKADICVDEDGKPEPDPELRDYENVPLKEDIEAYFKREVLPHVPDAWMDRSKDKVGYEINFNRHFYRYTPPRELAAIDADLKQAEEKILGLLKEVTA